MEQVAFGALNYTVLAFYICLVIGVGIFFARRQTSINDYFLGGRKLPWFAVAMSMYASVTSAMTFMGLPGLAYGQNVSLVIVCVMSPLVAPILIFYIYPLYRKLNLTTSYEYISLRFGKNARLCVSFLFVLARVSWLATVIYAPALALHVTTTIPLAVAISIIGLLATLYCVLGGLSAVVWTDVPQFIIMIGGAIFIALLLSGIVPEGVFGIIREAHLADKLAVFDWTLKPGHMTALAVAIAYAFILLQDYGVDQVSVQRLMAVKTNRGVSRAILFNAATDFFIIALLLFIGLGLHVYYQAHPTLLPEAVTPDKVMPWFILHEMPAGASGLIIAALFAAAMSSVDSGLNSITTVLMHDIGSALEINSKYTASVGTARVLTAGLGVLATIVALFIFKQIGGIISAFYTFMGLFSAPVLALFLLGMFTRKAGFKGWLIATILSIAGILLIQKYDWLHEIYFFPLSAVFTLATGYSLSRFLRSNTSNPAYCRKAVFRQ